MLCPIQVIVLFISVASRKYFFGLIVILGDLLRILALKAIQFLKRPPLAVFPFEIIICLWKIFDFSSFGVQNYLLAGANCNVA